MRFARGFIVQIMLAFVIGTIICSVSEAQRQRGQRGQRGQQPGGGPRGFGGGGFGGGGFGGGGGPIELARRADVQKELGMTETQKDQISEIAEDQRASQGDRFRQQFSNFRNLSDEERREAFARIQESRNEQREEIREKVNQILNRSQRSRFAELEFRYSLQRGDLVGALSSSGVKLSDDEREKLRDAQREARDEIQKRIAQIQLDANLDALGSVLDEARVERMMGDSFTFDTEQGRDRFARRGDRGGGQDQRRGVREREQDQDSNEGRSSRRSRRRRPASDDQ